MEIATSATFFDRMKNLAFKEKSYFLSRREINWGSLGKCAALALALGIIGILLIPAPKETPQNFTEQAQPGERPRLVAALKDLILVRLQSLTLPTMCSRIFQSSFQTQM